MNKEKIREAFVAVLRDQLDLLTRTAEEAHASASHPESRPEDKYDTRALETSYLAGAQSRRASELEEILAKMQQTEFPDVFDDDPIQVWTLVELAQGGNHVWFWLLPFLGGQSVTVEGTLITAISPDSPMGKALIGAYVGEDFSVGPKRYEIIQVV